MDNHIDTGEYAKLPTIPPFLQPSADYSNGVNFASGGGGVLPTTNQGLVKEFLSSVIFMIPLVIVLLLNILDTTVCVCVFFYQVIDLPTQLKYFEEVRKSLVDKFGSAEAEEIVSNAVYFISIGSNDYMGGYLGNPKMQELHPPEEYIGMVVGNLTQAIQVLSLIHI